MSDKKTPTAIPAGHLVVIVAADPDQLEAHAELARAQGYKPHGDVHMAARVDDVHGYAEQWFIAMVQAGPQKTYSATYTHAEVKEHFRLYDALIQACRPILEVLHTDGTEPISFTAAKWSELITDAREHLAALDTFLEAEQ